MWNWLNPEDPIFAIDQVEGEEAQFARMRELWDRNSDYNPLVSSDFFCGGFKEAFERNGERIARYLKAKLELDAAARVLDLGAGIGRIARYLVEGCERYVLADVSGQMLERARTRIGTGRAELARLVDNRLPWTDASFTHCIAIDVVQHLPERTLRAYFKEVGRLLVPGGRLLLTSGASSGADTPPDPQASRQLLRLLNLKPLPFGARTGPVLAELIADGQLRLYEQGDNFPNLLPMLPIQVPFAGSYLLFEKTLD